MRASPLMACAKSLREERAAHVDEALHGDRDEHEDEDEPEAVEQRGADEPLPASLAGLATRPHGRRRRTRATLVPAAGLGHAALLEGRGDMLPATRG